MLIDNKERATLFDDLHYVHPKVAYKKLKFAQNNNQSVYINGMTGYGKTSLALSILKARDIYCVAETVEPEDLIFPEQSKPITVVLDNIQFLPDNLCFEECVEHIKELARRDDIWLILVGRCRMPKWLLPIHLEEVFIEINEAAFLLSDDEVYSILKKWNLDISKQQASDIAQLAQYAPLSLRLIAINLVNGKTLDEQTIAEIREAIWECVWTNVYEKWDMDILDAAMKLSIVDEFDLELAKMITGRKEISAYIDRMNDLGNFLSSRRIVGENDMEYDVYSIRDLAKISLKYNMKKLLSKEEISKAYYNAGLYFECNDEPLKALKLYEEVGNLEQIAAVLINNSRQNPGSGHYYELRDYYLRLPDSIILENPDLMNGLSMLYSMLLNVEESERWYNELVNYANTVKDRRQEKRARQLILVLDIALPHRGSINMIKLLKNTGSLVANRKMVLPDFSVTSNLPSQMNGGKDFCEWSKNDKEIASTIGKLASIALGRYGKALVNLSLAESYFEKGGDSFDISTLLVTGRMQAESVNNVEQIFVADGILARLYLVEDKHSLAIEVIENYLELCKRENKTKIIPNVEAFLARLKLYTGDALLANEWFDNNDAVDDSFVTTERFIYLTKVRVYIINGKYKEAENLLQKMLYYSEVMNRTMIKIESLLLMAIVRLRSGEDDYDDFFCRCLDLASEYNFVRIISEEAGLAKQLLNRTKWTADTTQNEKFLNKVKSETERIARYYPAYLKENSNVISFSENAIAILRLQAEGYSINDIAKQLGLTVENVKYHSSQTYKKLDVKGKAGAVAEAKRRGII